MWILVAWFVFVVVAALAVTWAIYPDRRPRRFRDAPGVCPICRKKGCVVHR